MVYKNNIPAANDRIDESQPDLLNNFAQIDTTYKVDHIELNEPTNNGYHNKVTTAQIAAGSHPSTGATDCKLYAMEDSANIGLLQYSRGISSPVPTPLTTLQSPSALSTVNAGNAVVLFDMSGLTDVFFVLHSYFYNATFPTKQYRLSSDIVHYDGTNFTTEKLTSSYGVDNVTPALSGTNAQFTISATRNVDYHYTVQFLRIQ